MKKISLGIVAHVDAGKTTLTEALLYRTGAIRSAGRVDHGDSFLDTDVQERERGITIYSKEARIKTASSEIILLDTPGHVDFSAETERTLQVLDYAVLVVSGSEGVQGHTRTLWNLLKQYDVPVFLFVNKMDLDGADHQKVLRDIREELSDSCVDFTFWENGSSSSHADWLEDVSLGNEEMMNTLLETGNIPLEMIQEAVSERNLFPVAFGSALKMDGIDSFLRILDQFTLRKSYPDSFGARVYKVSRDSQGQRLTWMKITGGSLNVRNAVSYNGLSEKINEIRLYSGEKYDVCPSAGGGEICAVTGLTAAKPGQGFGIEESAGQPLLEPVLTYGLILPPDINAADFYRKLLTIEEEAPELHLLWDEEHKEIHVQIMGPVQIEVLTRLIKDRFGVNVGFGPGSIVYKETIASAVEGVGHFEPLRHYAEVHLLLEPGERGSGIQTASAVSEDELDLHWQRLILTHIAEKEHRGVLTGSPLTDVRITLLSGRASVKHTVGGDFRQATYRAVRQGLKSARSVLLEPYYAFTLEVPQDTVGRALKDLSDMAGKPEAPEFHSASSGEMAVIRGTAPVATMNDYINEVNTYTRGLGSLNLRLAGYDLCHNPEVVIKAARYDSEMDLKNPTGSVFCAHGAGFYVPWNQVPEYMHLPYTFVPEALKEEYASNDEIESFGADNGWGKGNRKKSGNSSYAEDDELRQIYERTFGHSSEREIMEERRKWTRLRASEKPVFRQKLDKHGKPIYPKQDTRQDYLIIDGYNIIFSWQSLNALKDVNINAARDKLLEIISNYQGYTGKKITVVFDAYKTDQTPEAYYQYDNLEIVFTKKDETADAYIEKTVHDIGNQYHITVATSDGLEQLTVMRLGALRMSARMLKEEVEQVTGRPID